MELFDLSESYFRVRDGGKYVTKAFLVITGIRDDGHREILKGNIKLAIEEALNMWINNKS